MTGSLVPLFHPRTQSWDENFTWSDDFTLILSLTPTGRATIRALHLNRVGLVNARRVLHAIGEHPAIPIQNPKDACVGQYPPRSVFLVSVRIRQIRVIRRLFLIHA